MFARFHYSIRPKAIVNIRMLVDLGGNAAAFSAKLDNLVLTTTSASEIQQKESLFEEAPGWWPGGHAAIL